MPDTLVFAVTRYNIRHRKKGPGQPAHCDTGKNQKSQRVLFTIVSKRTVNQDSGREYTYCQYQMWQRSYPQVVDVIACNKSDHIISGLPDAGDGTDHWNRYFSKTALSCPAPPIYFIPDYIDFVAISTINFTITSTTELYGTNEICPYQISTNALIILEQILSTQIITARFQITGNKNSCFQHILL